jgi:hypothetical protein
MFLKDAGRELGKHKSKKQKAGAKRPKRTQKNFIELYDISEKAGESQPKVKKLF